MFAYHFMVNAFRAGTIVAVVAAVAGWCMVLRRQTFTGHTLAVVGFPGAAAAVWLGVAALWGYFGLCVAAALVIGLAPARGTQRREDSAAIGVLQAFALAGGLLFISLYHGLLNGTTTLLFGNFLGITDGQVIALLVVALVVIAVLAGLGRPLLFASIDPDVAAARGVPVRAISLLFVLILGLGVAEVSQITGTLLVFALLVMPAASAQAVTVRPVVSLSISVAVSLAITWSALVAAYYSSYPIGFWVTTFGFATYLSALGVSSKQRTRAFL